MDLQCGVHTQRNEQDDSARQKESTVTYSDDYFDLMLLNLYFVEGLKHSHKFIDTYLMKSRSLSPLLEFEVTCINRVWQKKDYVTS